MKRLHETEVDGALAADHSGACELVGYRSSLPDD